MPIKKTLKQQLESYWTIITGALAGVIFLISVGVAAVNRYDTLSDTVSDNSDRIDHIVTDHKQERDMIISTKQKVDDIEQSVYRIEHKVDALKR